jgi:protein-S-isoprenylcysteine O-methyltransferase Ste14
MEFVASLLSLVIVGWLVFEVVLVLNDRRKATGVTRSSRASTTLTMVAMIVGLTLALNLSNFASLEFPGGRTIALFLIGFGLMISGFATRLWAIRTLGASFRTTLQVHEGQRIVKHGPYRFVRHPSYAGALLLCCGFGIALQNWLSLASAVGLPLVSYVYRINVEERMLVGTLGSEYLEYQKHTKKLVPWVW